MFEVGEVVFHDKLKFCEGVYDIKKKRPCIVLFETKLDNKHYVCTCPLTSSVKSFNKNPDYYVFIPETIYNYHKLSFANINNLLLQELEHTHSTGIILDSILTNKIINKIKESKLTCHEFYKVYLNRIEDEEKNKVKTLSYFNY